MRSWCLSVRLSFLISFSGCLSVIVASSVWAGEKRQDVGTQYQTSSQIRQLSEIELPKTNAQLLVQSPTPSNPPVVPGSIVTITGVKANPTDKGVEVILETTLGEQLQITNRSAENNFIADIPNAQLRLSSGEVFTFRSEKPVEGITEITVTNIDANTVRVTVVGVAALPTVELFDDDTGLVFAVASTTMATQPPQTPPTEEQPGRETPAAQQDDPIELTVTGERDSYRVPNASTATRTDTPLRDIPQSIQVVPQEVLRDRNVRTLTEAVETVSGVSAGQSTFGLQGTQIIRGFTSFDSGIFRNGFRDVDFYSPTAIGTIEQVEVVKGPASVLFGALEPGGIINTVTKKPLNTPYYNIAFEVGNYGFYQPSIDLSGPLTEDRNILYRFIASYQGSGSIQDFVNNNQLTIAPSIAFKLGDRTDLNLYYEYVDIDKDAQPVQFRRLSDGSLTPRNFYAAYPDFTVYRANSHRFGYILNHSFNDNWQIRNNIAVTLTEHDQKGIGLFNLPPVDDRFFQGNIASDQQYRYDNYFGQIDVLGKFNTGSVSHQILAGIDINYLHSPLTGFRNSTPIPDLDILNPNYNIPRPEFIPWRKFDLKSYSYGAYLQDQMALSDNLKLLIGGRYDWTSYDFQILDFGTAGNTVDEPVVRDSAFSPRIGLVYQPSKNISLYTSYSRSFKPTTEFNPDNETLKPSRGTQYEVGIKTDFLDGKLSATLAAYQITKTNILTPNPDPILAEEGFLVQTGEARSRGIELDIVGEILPGWKIIASYAHTDARVTQDEDIPVGNRLDNVPLNQASLWTTYEIQEGGLKGLGFGLGLFYVGERQSDLANSLQLPSYLRTDAALYYRRDRFNAAINVRNLFDLDYVEYAATSVRGDRGKPLTIIGSFGWTF
jgi:iron complex outermembrane recepter protein